MWDFFTIRICVCNNLYIRIYVLNEYIFMVLFDKQLKLIIAALSAFSILTGCSISENTEQSNNEVSDSMLVEVTAKEVKTETDVIYTGKTFVPVTNNYYYVNFNDHNDIFNAGKAQVSNSTYNAINAGQHILLYNTLEYDENDLLVKIKHDVPTAAENYYIPINASKEMIKHELTISKHYEKDIKYLDNEDQVQTTTFYYLEFKDASNIFDNNTLRVDEATYDKLRNQDTLAFNEYIILKGSVETHYWYVEEF